MMFKKKQKEQPSVIRYQQSRLQAIPLKKWLDDAVNKKKLIRN